MRKFPNSMSLVLLVTVVACGDGVGPEATGTAEVLLATDAPAAASVAPAPSFSLAGDVDPAAIEAIELTLTRIEVHRVGEEGVEPEAEAGMEGGDEGGDALSESGWIVMELEAETPIDLLTLPASGGLTIASATLPVGTYNQVRLFFSAATIRLGADVTLPDSQVVPAGDYALTVPSAANTGLKVQTGKFEVLADALETLVLELGLDATVATIKANSNGFRMNPVLKEK